MARPKTNTCTISTFLRDHKLYVRWSYAGMKVRIATEYRVKEEDLDKAGYLKRTRREDADLINPVLEIIRERLQEAHEILVGTGKELGEKAIKNEYERLSREAHEAAQVQQQAVAKRERTERKFNNLTRSITIEEDIPQTLAELEGLAAQMAVKRNELRNLQKRADVFEDDTLATFLTRYMSRKGERTLTANSKRTFSAFINTVRQFAPDARIQDVDDGWLYRFQDWLLDTPAAYRNVNGTVRYASKPRINSTVENYATKVKSCLNYYHKYPELLPADVSLNLKYKRWEFDLAVKEDNVICLEEWEVLLIKELLETDKLGTRKKAHYKAAMMLLFLCATGLRLSDAATISGADIQNGMIKKITAKTKRYTIEVHIPINPISAFVLSSYDYNMEKLGMEDYYFRETVKEMLDEPQLLPSFQAREKIVNFSGLKEVYMVNENESPALQKLGIRRCDAIGSHSGRRTFINILLDHNVPINKIMGMSGHITMKNLMVYANKRKHVERYTKNIFKLPAYEAQEYALPANLLLHE